MTKKHHSLPKRMSQPPTNSPFIYTCGMVGHSLPFHFNPTQLRTAKKAGRSRELLDPSSKFRIRQHIKRLHLFLRNSMQIQYLYHRP